MKFFKDLWNYIKDDGSFSYRSEAGVKLNVNGDGRASVDFDDPQTREILRDRLEKLVDVVDGVMEENR